MTRRLTQPEPSPWRPGLHAAAARDRNRLRDNAVSGIVTRAHR